MGKIEYTYHPVSEILCFDRRRPPLVHVDEFPWSTSLTYFSYLAFQPVLPARTLGFEMTRCPSCRKDRTTLPRRPTLLYYVDNAIVAGLHNLVDPAAHEQRLDIGQTGTPRRQISKVDLTE
jgi:hypothetical protein